MLLLQVEIVPVRNEADVVVLYLTTYRDITAFKVEIITHYDEKKSLLIFERSLSSDCFTFLRGYSSKTSKQRNNLLTI